MEKISQSSSSFSSSNNNNSNNNNRNGSNNHNHNQKKKKRSSKSRVVLLLDLDCFYAQCETVRLNLPQTLPLCLLQWNSALAVNYPAREYGIKRGDGFAEIQQKGKGKVVALHLPVLPISETTKTNNTTNEDNNDLNENNDKDEQDALDEEPSSIEELYEQTFQLSPEQQKLMYIKERNVIRSPKEGKASLERYRLASRRIFGVILNKLQEICGSNGGENGSNNDEKAGFILEKASIDELFVDVTEYCYSSSFSEESSSISFDDWGKQKTVVVHSTPPSFHHHHSHLEHEDDIEDDYDNEYNACDATQQEKAALWQGCKIAQCLRDAVFETLGFTLSAGISMNKLMAKLGAGYGKPNGQAVIFPNAITKVMEETKIRKVRNLGGKLGKSVLSLLPPDQDSVSSITRHLSLPQLAQHFKSYETANLIYNLSRGICNQPVKATHKVLNKSITSFKSFPKVQNVQEIQPYVTLLGKDLIKRVLLDWKWNHRWPKSCSLQYTIDRSGNSPDDNDGGSGGGGKSCKSLRISFISRTGKDPSSLEQMFIKQVLSTIEKKMRYSFPICRIGLSAIDFEAQCMNGGISSFFKTKTEEEPKKKIENYPNENDAKEKCASSFEDSRAPKGIDSFFQISTLDEISKKEKNLNKQSFHENEQIPASGASASTVRNMTPLTSKVVEENHVASKDDSDLAYALKLQASYDRESKVLSKFERNTKMLKGQPSILRKRRRDINTNISKSPHQKHNMGHFFSKKK